MKKPGLMFLFPVFMLLFSPVVTFSQNPDFTNIDTTAVYDSLIQELLMLGMLEKPQHSFFDLNTGLGNGTYALQSKTGMVNQHSLFFNAGAGYYHKSGFSLSGGMNAGHDGSKTRIMQGYISPSFDHYGDKVKTGLSFFRYFNNKNTEMYLSPLVNEFYGYVQYNRWYLMPKLAVDYAWGSVEELQQIARLDTVQQGRGRGRGAIVRRVTQEISTVSYPFDVSLIFSLKHDYYPRIAKKAILYSPSVSVIAGTGRYGSNLAVNSIGNRLYNTGQSGSSLLQSPEGSSTTATNDFMLTNLNLVQNVQASFGKTYGYAQLLISYNMPEVYRGWSTFFALGAGITL